MAKKRQHMMFKLFPRHIAITECMETYAHWEMGFGLPKYWAELFAVVNAYHAVTGWKV